MKDKKIIFMGTPDIAAQHLNILIENNFNIVGVFTQPPRKKNRGMRIEKSDVHQIAEKNNIEVFYPSSIDDIVIEQVKSLEPRFNYCYCLWNNFTLKIFKYCFIWMY